MTWRQLCAPVIHRVLVEQIFSDPKKIRKALREAYPFGERKYWPYKVWLDEIKRQRGQKREHRRRAGVVNRDHPGQLYMVIPREP